MKGSPEQQFRAAREMLERILSAGEDHAVERVLDEHAIITDAEDLVVELIYNEHLIREEQGESPELQEYVDRFPNYAVRIRKLFSIHNTLDTEENLLRSDPDSLPMPRLLSPGDTVGPFELLSSLGSGGRGFVFKARQVELDRIVALKVLKHNATNDQEITRFLAEAKATANLHHPNIVQVYESDIYDNLPYIALEYIAGGTLEEKFSGAPVAGNDAAKLIAVLAEAMQYSHDRGIVHRDLKPSNILLTESGTPKITDFGLAKRSQFSRSSAPQAITETGTVLGTPSYMAPEQAEGRNREIGPVTDVYGLGVVLYQLITGQVPFVGESILDVVQSICTLDPVAPSLLNPKVPRDLEIVCLKCLEKDPIGRYASAADLAADLDRFLAGRSIVARPSSLFQRFSKLTRRHPLTAALSAALVIAVIAVFSVISWQWNQAAIGERDQAVMRIAAEDALYSHQIALAHKEIKSSETLRALRILNSTDVRRRHWEWEYLAQSSDTYRTLGRLGPDTSRCVVSSDGSLLAVTKGRWGTDESGMLAVYDTESRTCLYTKESPFGPIMDAAFSPDGKTIASVGNRFIGGGGQVSFRDSRTGELQKTIPHPSSGLFGITYHPSLPRFALACADNSVEIWDDHSEQPIHQLKGHRANCSRVAFSPEGEQLASCSRDGTVRLWHAETGRQEAVLRAQKGLSRVAYTPDGRNVVVNGYDQAIQYWDRLERPPRGTKVHLAGDVPFTYDLAISSNGRYLTAFADGGRRLFSFDLFVGRVNFRSAETLNRPLWLTYHPRENRLYMVDFDGNVMESISQRANPFQRFVTASATAIAFDDDIDSIAIASGASRALPGLQDFRCRLFPLSVPDSEVRFYAGARAWASSVAVSQYGNVLACGCEDGSILQWSIDLAELLASSTFHEGEVICLNFLNENDHLISIGSDGWLAVWKGASAQPMSKVRLGTPSIRHAVSSADSKRVLVYAPEGLVALYAVRFDESMHDTEESVAPVVSPLWQTKYSDGEVKSIALSPEGQQVAVANQKSLDLWSMDSAENQPAWSVPMTLAAATDLAFHPDGRRLAVVDGWAGRVVLFDTANGQAVLELNARSGTDRANVAFSSSGDRLIATLSGELYVWSIPNRELKTRHLFAKGFGKSQHRTDLQWHVNQASEQIYGGLPLGAEFHARRALAIINRHGDSLEGMPALEVLTINARCHLAKAMIDSGRIDQGKEMIETILDECPNEFVPVHTVSLLLATYPGQSVVPSSKLLDLTDQALSLQPTSSDALATSGIAYLRNGDVAEARRQLDTAAKTMPSWEALVLFPLAILEAKSNNQEAAARLFSRGVEWMESTAPKQPIIRELHRWAAEGLGR